MFVGANSIDIEVTILSGSNGNLGIGVSNPQYNLHVNEIYSTTYHNLPDISANVILEKLKTVDGDDSGLDADVLDGQHGSYYLDYNNLINKPVIQAAQIQSDWTQTNTAALDYIKNKPAIPAGQVQSDWDVSNNASVAYIKNMPDYYLNNDDLRIDFPVGTIVFDKKGNSFINDTTTRHATLFVFVHFVEKQAFSFAVTALFPVKRH